MCRWLAYSGDPLDPAALLVRPKFSLIDQSLHSRMGATTTNGDGFGLGWYSPGHPAPAVFRSIEPAWNDRNVVELATVLKSPLFLAHIRASTGTPVQQTNCHPFRFENWLFMHNGRIAEFGRMKRDLAMAVAPELYPHIEGSTDSETLFHLALTFGLRDDPLGAVARAVGFVEQVADAHEVADAVQMTLATTDGTTLWAFRYATTGTPRTLFVSDAPSVLRGLYPMQEAFTGLSDETRVVVSEPLTDLENVFIEIAAGSAMVVQPGDDVTYPFAPVAP